MRAALYARYSDDLQRPASIVDQVALCRRVAEQIGAEVVEIYTDAAISGFASANRPGLLALLEAAHRRQFDVVIAEAIDRLSRGGSGAWSIYEDMQTLGIEIVTAEEQTVDEMKVGSKAMFSAMFLKGLAAKTRRGLAGVAREGRHAGGRVYGYKRVIGFDAAGEPIRGRIEIEEAEAEVVRRIFREYVAGASPRAIAARLNAEGVPGPRGGPWNASTINGNAARGNGVLHNQLYSGWIVWGRQTWVKDRRTGKRRSRKADPANAVRTRVPELQIVDDPLWAAAQAAYAQASAGPMPSAARRPKHLLSGLVRCGVCDGAMTMQGPDRRFVCITRKERGIAGCSNGRTAKAPDIEARILVVLREELLHPAAIAAAVEAYRAHADAARHASQRRRSELERELGEAKRRAARLVDQLADGAVTGRAIADRLAELEARRAELEGDLARLEAAAAGQLRVLHPRAAEFYREKVEALKAALEASGPDGLERDEARQAFRQVVRAVMVYPLAERGQYELAIAGDLADLLRLSPEGPASLAASPRYLGGSWVRG